MKKVLVLVAALFLLGSATNAMASGKWKLQVDTGVDILTSGWTTDTFGIGLGLGVGYAVSDNLSFWLISNGYLRPTSLTGVTALLNEAVLSMKYDFSAGTSPYVRVGLGSETSIVSVSGFSLSASNLMLQGGLGVDLPAGSGLNFFLEADYGLILASGATGGTVPLTAGIDIDL